MADPVASVEKIIKIGLKIKEAVDTVRRNKEVCLEIRKKVLRYSTMLRQLQQRGVMHNSLAMSGPLEDLAETLERALELVTAYQERSTISSFISAGDLSKQLRQMKENILEQVMLSLWALNVHNTMVLLAMQDAIPLSRLPEDTTVAETSFHRSSTDDERSKLYCEGNNILLETDQMSSIPSVDFKRLSLSELKAAIDGKNIIGSGGACTTFKAVSNDGNKIAVKIFPKHTMLRHCPMAIYDHVSKLEHKNIVKVLGCYYEYKYQPYVVRLLKGNNDRAVEKVYWVEELVPNGSLYDIIMDGSQKIEWSSLFRIIEGIAQALHYLHEQHIVHMDVKPDNILLDSDMNPKITDFDASTVLPDSEEFDERLVRGTIGFIDPAYFDTMVISTKNDVYGFGATLLETVSCMRKPPRQGYSSDHFFHKWVREVWQAGRVEELFDPSLFDCSQLTEIKRCIDVGFLCIQNYREDRPTMADVLEMLNGKAELPTPKKPWCIRSNQGPASSSENEGPSENEVPGSPSAWSDGSLSPR